MPYSGLFLPSHALATKMKIAYLILPSMLVTSFSNAFELMYAARMKALSSRLPIAKRISLNKVATSKASVSLNTGLSIHPEKDLDDELYDMVFVPALWRNPRPLVAANLGVVEWLRRQWEHGAVINATGTGVCFVAESGLLDAKVATTHWHHFDAFAQDYPSVNLKRQHFITGAGKLFCAASINAQTDLVLHHVHRFIDKSVSEHLSRHFSHEVRQPYDRLSFEQEKQNALPDEAVLQAQLWIQNNLNKANLRLDGLAARVGMSQRNFARRFRQATGTTPLKYLQQQRYIEAQDLLKNSDLNIGEVAFRLGYLDVSYFSKLFRLHSGVTPTQWRSSVRGKLFD